MELKIKKLHPDAIMPTYGTDGAACFDLYCLEFVGAHPKDSNANIFETGIAVEVPPGWCLEINSRSGQGFNDAVRLSNCTGQIDSDYRGSIKISLRWDSDDEGLWPRYGDRIAQAKLVPSPRLTLVEVDELSETVRGTGGFGSTGA